MKQLISCILTFCILTTVLSTHAAAAADGFSDVNRNDWFYAPVMASSDAGLIAGNPDGRYLPHKELSWAETVVFAVRLDQYISGAHIYGAEDQTGIWYSIYTDYARERDFIDSVPADPTAPITRGDAANIFYGVLAWYEYDTLNSLYNNHFSDVPYHSPYNRGVMALAEAGIVNGVSDGVFGVDKTFKRSEVATIVARMASLAEKVSISRPPVFYPSLLIDGLDTDTLIEYFAEVALDTEYGDKAFAQYVRKWTDPIYYVVRGNPNATDLAVLEQFTAELNAIPGFPGIYPAVNDSRWNLDIHFCDLERFNDLMSESLQNHLGGVRIWYRGYEIYSARIAIRTDVSQETRNSIIQEEIYNGLGLIQDTSVRTDSLIYQYKYDNKKMSPEDKLILTLLYHEDILPQMGYDECAAIIKTIYK